MTTFDRPAACLTCQPFESAHPPPLILQPSHSGPITLRVMGMEGSRSAGPIGLAHPRSRGSRRGSSGPSQHADASQAVRLPSCSSWPRSSEPPRNLRRRVHSAPPLPLAPSPPMPSRRPSAALRVRAPLSGLAAYGGYGPRLPGGRNKVRRDGGEGAPAALTAFGTTTAASESGVG